MNEGKLPTFKKLVDSGISGTLFSTIPPMTYPAWAAIASGKKPTKTGAYTSISYDYKVGYVWFKKLRGPFLWDILSEKGYKVVVANVPFIKEAYKVRGYMVASSDCLRREFLTYPKKLSPCDKELERSLNNIFFGKNEEEFLLGKYDIPHEIDKYFEWILEREHALHYIFKYLLDKKWDFAFIVYDGADGLQHKTWNKHIISKYYEDLDRRLNEIVRIAKEQDTDTTLFIVSDHGAGPASRIFYLNKWLIKEGYLSIKRSPRTYIDAFLGKISSKNHLFIQKIKSRFPKRLLGRAIRTSWLYDLDRIIDWQRTLAFSLGTNFGEIWINLKGRYRNGIVPLKKYNKVKQEIVAKLRKITWNGQSIRLEVFNKKKINPVHDRSADLVVLINDEVTNIFPWIDIDTISKEQIKLFEEISDAFVPNTHRIDGVMIINGLNINFPRRILNATVYDIAPTILALFHIKPSRDSDGKPLINHVSSH